MCIGLKRTVSKIEVVTLEFGANMSRAQNGMTQALPRVKRVLSS
jgi:hypothetical protein